MSSQIEHVQEYSKPGQKQPTPPPGAGDRVFYESLFREKPSSEMALIWCIEHGVLSEEEAQRVFPRYTQAKNKASKKEQASSGTPAAKKPSSSAGKVLTTTADPGMAVGGVETMTSTTF
jgi:hypothetical protein